MKPTEARKLSRGHWYYFVYLQTRRGVVNRCALSARFLEQRAQTTVVVAKNSQMRRLKTSTIIEVV